MNNSNTTQALPVYTWHCIGILHVWYIRTISMCVLICVCLCVSVWVWELTSFPGYSRFPARYVLDKVCKNYSEPRTYTWRSQGAQSAASVLVAVVYRIRTKPRGRPRPRYPVLASISPRHGPDRVIRILFPVPCSFHCLLGIQSITGWPHQLPKLHTGEIFHQHGHLHSLAPTWGEEKECGKKKKQQEIMRLIQSQKYKAASR